MAGRQVACMLALFSRMAKQDKRCVIEWESLMPRLVSQCLMAIEIPVGGSLASSPIGRRPPRECLMLFSVECVPRARSAAKLLIYLLHPTKGSLPHIKTLAGKPPQESFDPLTKVQQSGRSQVYHFAHPSQ